MAETRTEREKLVEALRLHADKPTPCREPEPDRPMDPCPVAYPDDPKAWCRDCLGLAAADLLSEEGEPTEPTEMFVCEIPRLILHPDQPYIFRVDQGCDSCREYLRPGPVQEASGER